MPKILETQCVQFFFGEKSEMKSHNFWQNAFFWRIDKTKHNIFADQLALSQGSLVL